MNKLLSSLLLSGIVLTTSACGQVSAGSGLSGAYEQQQTRSDKSYKECKNFLDKAIKSGSAYQYLGYSTYVVDKGTKRVYTVSHIETVSCEILNGNGNTNEVVYLNKEFGYRTQNGTNYRGQFVLEGNELVRFYREVGESRVYRTRNRRITPPTPVPVRPVVISQGVPESSTFKCELGIFMSGNKSMTCTKNEYGVHFTNGSVVVKWDPNKRQNRAILHLTNEAGKPIRKVEMQQYTSKPGWLCYVEDRNDGQAQQEFCMNKN